MAFIVRRVLSRFWLHTGPPMRVLERSLGVSPAHGSDTLITPGIRKHLKNVLQRHNNIVEKLSSENVLKPLETVVKYSTVRGRE